MRRALEKSAANLAIRTATVIRHEVEFETHDVGGIRSSCRSDDVPKTLSPCRNDPLSVAIWVPPRPLLFVYRCALLEDVARV